MVVILLGSVTEIRPVQPSKASYLIVVTLLGIVTEVRPVQFAKAYSPILVILFGILISVRADCPLKASFAILVTLFGITVVLQPYRSVFVAVFIIALQFSRLSYTVLPLSTTIEVNPLHSVKTYAPMLVTPLGIVIAVRPEHP